MPENAGGWSSDDWGRILLDTYRGPNLATLRPKSLIKLQLILSRLWQTLQHTHHTITLHHRVYWRTFFWWYHRSLRWLPTYSWWRLSSEWKDWKQVSRTDFPDRFCLFTIIPPILHRYPIIISINSQLQLVAIFHLYLLQTYSILSYCDKEITLLLL